MFWKIPYSVQERNTLNLIKPTLYQAYLTKEALCSVTLIHILQEAGAPVWKMKTCTLLLSWWQDSHVKKGQEAPIL